MRMLLLLLCLMSSSVLLADELSKSDKLKAAYLFNFTKYIDWPATRVDSRVLNICSYASTEFNTFLKALVQGRTVKEGRTILVLQPQSDTTDCNLVFLKQLPPATFSSDALLIGDNASYKQAGASIHFFQENRRLRFEVDLQRIEQQDLKISSELLKLARVVNLMGDVK